MGGGSYSIICSLCLASLDVFISLHKLPFTFAPPPFQEVRVGPWVQPTLLIRSWFQFEYFVIINFRIVLQKLSFRINAVYYLKDQRRPSFRLATVMFRGTPCTYCVPSCNSHTESYMMEHIPPPLPQGRFLWLAKPFSLGFELWSLSSKPWCIT